MNAEQVSERKQISMEEIRLASTEIKVGLVRNFLHQKPIELHSSSDLLELRAVLWGKYGSDLEIPLLLSFINTEIDSRTSEKNFKATQRTARTALTLSFAGVVITFIGVLPAIIKQVKEWAGDRARAESAIAERNEARRELQDFRDNPHGMPSEIETPQFEYGEKSGKASSLHLYDHMYPATTPNKEKKR